MKKDAVVVCDACHSREARVFKTTIIGGQARSVRLCEGCCANTLSPTEVDQIAAIEAASCRYCGGPYVTKVPGLSGMSMGGEDPEFVCGKCIAETARFFKQRFDEIRASGSKDEQRAALQKLEEEAALHMKRWISEGN